MRVKGKRHHVQSSVLHLAFLRLFVFDRFVLMVPARPAIDPSKVNLWEFTVGCGLICDCIISMRHSRNVAPLSIRCWLNESSGGLESKEKKFSMRNDCDWQQIVLKRNLIKDKDNVWRAVRGLNRRPSARSLIKSLMLCWFHRRIMLAACTWSVKWFNEKKDRKKPPTTTARVSNLEA